MRTARSAGAQEDAMDKKAKVPKKAKSTTAGKNKADSAKK
jgi:hypothetical protein